MRSLGAIQLKWESLVAAGWRLAFEPHIFGGLGCYVISVVIWILALSRVEVSIAYPMLSIGYVVNAAAAYVLFGEAVTPFRLLGIGVIIVGVYIVARSCSGGRLITPFCGVGRLVSFANDVPSASPYAEG